MCLLNCTEGLIISVQTAAFILLPCRYGVMEMDPRGFGSGPVLAVGCCLPAFVRLSQKLQWKIIRMLKGYFLKVVYRLRSFSYFSHLVLRNTLGN